MKKIKWICIALLISSCEKNIDFKLNDTEPKLVVDAFIENDKSPEVVLTNSFSFYNEVSTEVYLNSFIHNADVYISNGNLVHKLKEYSRPLFPGVNTYYYGIDSSNLSTAFVGEFNTNYQLRILAEGREYISTTKIPNNDTKIDTIFFKHNEYVLDTTEKMLYMTINDPLGKGNYTRFLTKKNEDPFYAGPNSANNDDVIDGTTFTVQLNNPPTNRLFLSGDTVTLKFCNIDKATYTFWNTWEFASQSIGNPFSQPNKVVGNISNGALGCFCGYAAWYRTLIVP
jgi:hypothetical protein